jgi:regulatory protein
MVRLRNNRKTNRPHEGGVKAPATPEERRRRTFERAIKLLSAKSRSVAELRELLTQNNDANKSCVDEVLARLSEYGYLNDERFALSYASARVRQRPIGRQRLKRDLTLKKVIKETVDEALDLVFAETPEAELIDRAIEKRTRLRGRPSNRAEAKSLFDHLLRQGFPFELVVEKVRAASRTNLDEDETN